MTPVFWCHWTCWLMILPLDCWGQESVIVGHSSDVQSELGVVGDSSVALSESVIVDSLSLSSRRGIKTVLRVLICGVLWDLSRLPHCRLWATLCIVVL